MTVEEIRGDGDNFPVGLRVLAVDDDPICLKLLETLLRKCQYHVTTTSQARMALKMLRENKDRFDLVISDVHMPDMNGFKLLEYVGLEMDLPVIMLSANGDPKLVMKGVTHGACDYLVKPVRIEELRNIWQHVLRRKKCDNKNPKKSSGQVKSHQTNGEGGLGSPLGNADQNGKFNRKRKEDEDESEDNENDEDPSTQKKPRVVWSIELHRKFVGAVNQLGIEKAVPKRILDLMNVDGLTRENVASHLQKYRLYLKRISSAASQQAHMAAAFGVKDSPFMHHMGSLDGLGDFRTLSSARLPNVVLSPYTTPTNGMLGRLNSPSANVSLRNLSPSVGPLQPSQAQNLSNSIASLNKMNFGTQNTSLFQGIPSHLEQNATNNNSKGILGTSNFNGIDEILNGVSFNPEPFDASGSFGSSNPLLSSTDAFHSQLPLVNGSRRNDSSLNGAYLNTDFSSGVGLVGGEVHNMNYGNNIFGSLNSPNISGNGIVSRLGRSLGQNNVVSNQRMDGFVNGRSSVSGGSNLLQQNEIEKPVNELRQRSDEDSFVLEETTRLNAGFVPQSYDSLDELVNAMIKREQDETVSTCEFQFDDDYAFGNGI